MTRVGRRIMFWLTWPHRTLENYRTLKVLMYVLSSTEEIVSLHPLDRDMLIRYMVYEHRYVETMQLEDGFTVLVVGGKYVKKDPRVPRVR